jgi:hypothetical protein
MFRERLEEFGQKSTAAMRAGVAFGLLAWADIVIASMLLLSVKSTFGVMIVLTLWATALYGALRVAGRVWRRSLPENEDEIEA